MTRIINFFVSLLIDQGSSSFWAELLSRILIFFILFVLSLIFPYLNDYNLSINLFANSNKIISKNKIK